MRAFRCVCVPNVYFVSVMSSFDDVSLTNNLMSNALEDEINHGAHNHNVNCKRWHCLCNEDLRSYMEVILCAMRIVCKSGMDVSVRATNRYVNGRRWRKRREYVNNMRKMWKKSLRLRDTVRDFIVVVLNIQIVARWKQKDIQLGNNMWEHIIVKKRERECGGVGIVLLRMGLLYQWK